MIDIDTIIQNIEDKIHFLEKLKFDDDPKNYLYTPIKGVTITSSTDFKQLECQKFMRCAKSNKLVPLEKFKDSVVALKDENSENLNNFQEKKAKIASKAVGQVTVQHKRNYRRNSIANFEPKVPVDQKSNLAGKKRRNSTKFDTKSPSEVNNAKNPLENGQKKPRVYQDNLQKNSKPITAQTSSPLVNPRVSLSTQSNKSTPMTKPDQQPTLKRPTTQLQTPTTHSTGLPKFSRSYTEFLNNLNKDMLKFKEQQKRNEPCDNFLGKDAKIFVEDPISKLVGVVKDTKVISSAGSAKNVDTIKTNDNKDKTVKRIEPKIESKPITTTVDSISINKMEPTKSDIMKIPDSPPKAPVYGTKYLVKSTKPHFEPNKAIFGKIIKNPPENDPQPETKSLSKIVMRRMTIDSAWDHRSLLRTRLELPDGGFSPTIQRIQPKISTSAEKSSDKLQKVDHKIPIVNQELIHQKITRLSPQKTQHLNLIDPKTGKLIKPQPSLLKNLAQLKHKIPRRNSIGYGVKIETVGYIKRIKLSQEVQESLKNIESAKKVKDLANGSSKLKKKEQKVRKNVENVGKAGNLYQKLGEASIDKIATFKNMQTKQKEELNSKPDQNIPNDSIDYEDELECISACHIDKLAPKGTQNKDQSRIGGNSQDLGASNEKSIKKSRKSANLVKIKIDKGNRKIKANKSVSIDDNKVTEPKMINIIAQSSPELEEKIKKPKKNSNGNEKKLKFKIIQSKDLEMQLSSINNNLEQIVKKDQSIDTLKNSEDKPEPKEIKVESSEKSEEDNSDVVTSKTMDIFREIENYRNLIKQQSSDSQNSKKSCKSQIKIENTATNPQENYKKELRINSETTKLQNIGRVAQNDDQILQEGSLKIKTVRKLQKVDKIKHNTNSQLQTSSQPTQDSSQTSTSSQHSTKSSQSSQSSSSVTPTQSQPLQTLQNSTPTPSIQSQSSQSPQSSNPATPMQSQSPPPSDSQNSSTSDQTLGKRRRQINPKYKESEYMLKNTSREFTNAIRSKMMMNKSLKAAGKKQSNNPEEQSAEKLEISDENCETKNSEELPSTSQPSTLQQQTHQKSSEIKCEICSKTFVKPQGLTRHMQLHSADRRYKCSKCDYRFKQSSDMMRHMLIHEGSPTIPCPKCDKKFRTSKTLQSHLETHEAALPYKCDQCEIRFRSTKNLRYHLMSHHSGVKFQCGYCGSKFSDEKSLRTHVMQHENEEEDLDDEELEDYLDFMDEEEEELDSDDEQPMVIAE